MPETKQKLIASFSKNSVEVVRVHLQPWKSQRYVDIRVFILQRADKPEDAIATKKGVTLSVGLLPELKKAIDLVLAEIEEDSGEG